MSLPSRDTRDWLGGVGPLPFHFTEKMCSKYVFLHLICVKPRLKNSIWLTLHLIYNWNSWFLATILLHTRISSAFAWKHPLSCPSCETSFWPNFLAKLFPTSAIDQSAVCCQLVTHALITCLSLGASTIWIHSKTTWHDILWAMVVSWAKQSNHQCWWVIHTLILTPSLKMVRWMQLEYFFTRDQVTSVRCIWWFMWTKPLLQTWTLARKRWRILLSCI